MGRIKDALFSEKGMGTVNILFMISAFMRNSGIIIAAFAAWIIYLVFGIKNTTSKAVKTVNTVFIVFALIMIALNLYFLFSI